MNTIKKNNDITYILKKGKTFKFPFLNLVIYNDKKDEILGSVAFIAGKKNGNAVWRNKSKRRLREIYKNLDFLKQYKTLLIANKNLFSFKYSEILNKCKNLENNEKNYKNN